MRKHPEAVLQKKRRGFQMPHVFIILTIVMVIVWMVSFIVPSGNFARVTDPTSGREIVDPNTFTFVEKSYITPDVFFQSFYQGIVGGINIMANLLICSGVLGVLESTGSFAAGIHKLIRATKGKEISLVIILYVLFTLFGVLGYGEGAYPFFALGTTVIMMAGYDRMTGAAAVLLGSCCGFACGMLNLFTTGVSQQIVGLPMFSGIGYRAVVLAVFFGIGLVFILHYAHKIRKDPTKSLVYDEYKDQDAQNALGEEIPMTWRHVVALIGFLVVTVLQGYGCVALHWSFPQHYGAVHRVHARAGGAVPHRPERSVPALWGGCGRRVLVPAIAIGLANAVMVLLQDANIMGHARLLYGQRFDRQEPAAHAFDHLPVRDGV